VASAARPVAGPLRKVVHVPRLSGRLRLPA
jgi:hypothetical protein